MIYTAKAYVANRFTQLTVKDRFLKPRNKHTALAKTKALSSFEKDAKAKPNMCEKHSWIAYIPKVSSRK
jgi:hypothetical protein